MEIDLGACIRGDRRAWDAFVARYAGVIVAAVQRTLGGTRAPAGPDDVEDRVQEVLLRLVRDDFRLLRTYDPARAAMTTWLTLVTRSVAIDHIRRRRLDAVSLDTVDPPDRKDSLRADAPHTPATAVPMHLLTSRQRLVLRMLFDEGLPVAEAASLLGVDDQTVRSTKHKALTRLREHFREIGELGARPDESPAEGTGDRGGTRAV